MKEVVKKYLTTGIWSLSDKELLSAVLDSDVAERIYANNDGSLKKIMRLNMQDVTKYKGISEAKAVSFIAMREIVHRTNTSYDNKTKISKSSDAYALLSNLSDMPYEQFWIILLNKANIVLNKVMISDGGISGTVVDPKKIFKIALDNHASSIILCHNHPSGVITPSEADVKITKKIRDAGEMLEISVLDHIIIGDNNFYSFANEGAM